MQSRRRFVLLSVFTWLAGFAISYPILHYAGWEKTDYVKKGNSSGSRCELKWTNLSKKECYDILKVPNRSEVETCDYYIITEYGKGFIQAPTPTLNNGHLTDTFRINCTLKPIR